MGRADTDCPARGSTLLKIPAVGVKTAAIIVGWQKRSHFSDEVEWVGEMIQEDARRCLELDEKVKQLEAKIAGLAAKSRIAKIVRSVPGFGAVCSSELAGEIGTIERFSKEGSWPCTWAWLRWTTVRGNTKGPRHPSK